MNIVNFLCNICEIPIFSLKENLSVLKNELTPW